MNPLLMLAPMEGLTHAGFRKIICQIGSVDTVATEFIRITGVNQTIRSFERPKEVPLQIQLMASDSETVSGSIVHLKKYGVLFDDDWIDLNVGCPSRRVNSHGAGAALLKEPEKIITMLEKMRSVHTGGKLSLKTRLGFESDHAFPELIKRLGDAPIDLVTFHARIHCRNYEAPISFDRLRYAATELSIPVIGNGDIFTPEDSIRMLDQTGVAGVMCGRGAVINPFLFRDIRQSLAKETYSVDPLTRREALYQIALELLHWLKKESNPKKKRNQTGPFKEFATWLSRNELIGKEFFQNIKRMQQLGEIEDYVQQQLANKVPDRLHEYSRDASSSTHEAL